MTIHEIMKKHGLSLPPGVERIERENITAGRYVVHFMMRDGHLKRLGRHRFVILCLHGELPIGLHTHHLDCDRTNDEPTNLVVLHSEIHMKLHQYYYGCRVDGYLRPPEGLEMFPPFPEIRASALDLSIPTTLDLEAASELLMKEPTISIEDLATRMGFSSIFAFKTEMFFAVGNNTWGDIRSYLLPDEVISIKRAHEEYGVALCTLKKAIKKGTLFSWMCDHSCRRLFWKDEMAKFADGYCRSRNLNTQITEKKRWEVEILSDEELYGEIADPEPGVLPFVQRRPSQAQIRTQKAKEKLCQMTDEELLDGSARQVSRQCGYPERLISAERKRRRLAYRYGRGSLNLLVTAGDREFTKRSATEIAEWLGYTEETIRMEMRRRRIYL